MSEKIDIQITTSGDAAEKVGGIRGAIGGLIGDLGKIGLAGLGVDSLKEGFNSVLEPALQAQQTLAQTNAVLASTHDASGMTAEGVEGLATSLSKVTPFAKDVVQSSENMLLTFTNIGSTVMPQATEATLNMAQALGEDTKSAAMQLGKALNDPVAGVTALQRVGVKLTEGQKEMVAQMVKSGDTMGAQKLILGELDNEFGNSARAAGTTFAGQLAILHNRSELLREQIGMKLIPVLTMLLGYVFRLDDWLGPRLASTVSKLTSIFAGPLQSALTTASGLFKDIVSQGGDLGVFADDLHELFGINIGPLVQAQRWLEGVFRVTWIAVRDAALTFIQAIQGNWTDSSKIEGIHRVVGNLGLALRNAWTEAGKLVGKAKDLWDAVSPLLPPLGTLYGYWRDISTIMAGPLVSALIGAVKGFGSDGLSGVLPGAEQGLRNFLSAAEDLGGLTLDLGGKLLDALQSINWSDLAGKIATGIGTAWGALTNAATYAYQWISGAFKSVNWSGLASSIATGIGTAWGKLTTASVWLYQWISNGLKGVNWAGLGTSISAGLSGALASVKGVSTQSSALSGFFTSISKGFDSLMTAIAPFVAIWKGQLQAIFANLQTTLANIKPTLEPLVASFGKLGAAIEPLGKLLAGALLVYITVVLEEFVLLSQALSVILPAAIQIATGVINGLADLIATIITVIQDLVSIVMDLVHGDWSAAWSDAKQLASDAITGVITVVGDLAAGIFTAIDTATGGALTRFAQWVTDSVTSATNWVTGVVTAIGDFVTSGPSKIGDAITAMIVTMVAAVQQFIDEGVAWIAGIISGIAQKVGELASKVGAIPGNILSALGDVSSTLYDAGVSIIKGLIGGIVSEVEGGLKDAVSGIAGKISSWKGPLDYDKTLLVPHGQAIIDGLITGMTNRFDPLKAAAEQAAAIITVGVGSPYMPSLPGQGHGSPFMPALPVGGHQRVNPPQHTAPPPASIVTVPPPTATAVAPFDPFSTIPHGGGTNTFGMTGGGSGASAGSNSSGVSGSGGGFLTLHPHTMDELAKKIGEHMERGMARALGAV